MAASILISNSQAIKVTRGLPGAPGVWARASLIALALVLIAMLVGATSALAELPERSLEFKIKRVGEPRAAWIVLTSGAMAKAGGISRLVRAELVDKGGEEIVVKGSLQLSADESDLLVAPVVMFSNGRFEGAPFQPIENLLDSFGGDKLLQSRLASLERTQAALRAQINSMLKEDSTLSDTFGLVASLDSKISEQQDQKSAAAR